MTSRDWSVQDWENWWKNPGARPKDDEEETDGKDNVEDSYCEEEFDWDDTKESPMLVKHLPIICGEGRKLRIFLTFCGKSIDLKWLATQGHEVYGNDCSSFALKSFLEEQNIAYDAIKVGQFDVFKAKDFKLTLIGGDFMKVTPDICGEKFDAIWDTASFQSAPINLRKEYIDTVYSLMKPRCQYLMSITDFKDQITWKGPPYTITDCILDEFFGKYMTWKMVDSAPWGTYLEQIFHLQIKK